MIIEGTQTSPFYENDTLMHHVNSVFVKQKSASMVKSMINMVILF